MIFRAYSAMCNEYQQRDLQDLERLGSEEGLFALREICAKALNCNIVTYKDGIETSVAMAPTKGPYSFTIRLLETRNRIFILYKNKNLKKYGQEDPSTPTGPPQEREQRDNPILELLISDIEKGRMPWNQMALVKALIHERNQLQNTHSDLLREQEAHKSDTEGARKREGAKDTEKEALMKKYEELIDKLLQAIKKTSLKQM